MRGSVERGERFHPDRPSTCTRLSARRPSPRAPSRVASCSIPRLGPGQAPSCPPAPTGAQSKPDRQGGRRSDGIPPAPPHVGALGERGGPAHPSTHTTIHPTIHPSIHPAVHPSICPSIQWFRHVFLHQTVRSTCQVAIHPAGQTSGSRAIGVGFHPFVGCPSRSRRAGVGVPQHRHRPIGLRVGRRRS